MNSKSDESDRRRSRADAATDSTQWSLFERVQYGNHAECQEAIGRLAETYSGILLDMTQRLQWQVDDATARDYVQSFLEQRILNGELIRQADPDRGSFRKFLFVSFRNFSIDRLRAELRHSTTFGRSLVDDASIPVSADMSHGESHQLDIAWARELLQQIIVRMRSECQHCGQMRAWHIFEGRLLRPITHFSKPVSYTTLARQYGFNNVKEAADMLTTAKRIFRRVSRSVIDEQSAVGDSDAELQSLRNVFSSGISLAEPNEKEDAGRVTQRSWLLARALELPPHEPYWRPDDLASASREILAQRLSDFSPESDGLSNTERPTTDLTLEEFLGCRPRSLAILTTLKDWLKQEFVAGEAGFPPAVISAVYFTVLAAASADHCQRLSHLTDTSLQNSIESLIGTEWLPEVCREVMKCARPFSG